MKWHVEQVPWGGQVDIKIVDQSGHVMAVVTPNLFTSGETADLLAAAPELLAALEAVLPWLGKALADEAFRDCVAPRGAILANSQALAAVARAKGAA